MRRMGPTFILRVMARDDKFKEDEIIALVLSVKYNNWYC